MTENTITIHNLETDEVVVREMTEDELNQKLQSENSIAQQELKKAQEAQEKNARKQTILAKLDLTEEEFSALIENI